MSTHYNDGSHYENHQRAAELHDVAHAHRSADEQRGKQDHLTGHEHSRQAQEHSGAPRQLTEHGAATFGHDEIAARAHQLWEARGCPEGSPQEDWFHAAEELRSRS
jgi:hypothetical protein